MTTLRMPDLGTVEGSVTLVRWLKSEGDPVALGEPLFEVLELNVDDPGQMPFVKVVENDNVIQAIQKLGPEVCL